MEKRKPGRPRTKDLTDKKDSVMPKDDVQVEVTRAEPKNDVEVEADLVLFRCVLDVNQTRMLTRQRIKDIGGPPFCPICGHRMAVDATNEESQGRRRSP